MWIDENYEIILHTCEWILIGILKRLCLERILMRIRNGYHDLMDYDTLSAREDFDKNSERILIRPDDTNLDENRDSFLMRMLKGLS